MPLSPGSKLGPYEIQAQIGAGGMGEVYKARDTRLNRTVAVKVCKEQFSERFHKEAEAIAALNHPHICHLYDVGPNYLVMEYVEGAQLKGPLPLELALKYADQICQALDEAHRKGITHRDLKPANILVTKSAGVKLLDFGLARVEDGEDATVTMEGGVKGTPAYMSPEQWQGKPGDARSDIYAFGCVLYEILTGQSAAAQRTKLEPPALESIVRTCLEKDPDARWQSASDLRRALAMPMTVPAVPKRNPWREWTAWIAVAVAMLVSLVAALRPSPTPAVVPTVRLSINPPENTVLTGPPNASVPAPQVALSPDGRSIVFAAAAIGARPMLWLRSLETGAAHAMPGTEGGNFPFWSPDSLSVGFFADGKLKRVNAAGGPAVEITDVSDPRGGAWGPDGTILFGTGALGIFRVSSSAGAGTPLTERDTTRQEGSHRFPEWLPDGRHFFYSVRSSLKEQQGVYAGSLDGKTKKLLFRGLTSALYSPSGHLLFEDGDALMAQAFDAQHLELRGQPFVLDDHVARTSFGNVPVSISRAGILAHAQTLSEPGRLTWFDRSGNPAEAIGPPGDYLDFRLSPDQKRLASSLVDPKKGFPDLWLTELALGNPAPFASGDWVNQLSVWSPDGTRILFRTTRYGGVSEFYTKSAGGGGTEEPVLLEQAIRHTGIGTATVTPWDWSPDGKYVLFTAVDSDPDLWLLPLEGGRRPMKYLSARGEQLHGNFSPDGHLVAYTSNESGRYEVHVQTFPLSERQWTVSATGGSEPRWRADGRELYYLSLDNRLMAVPVNPGGPSLGPPRQLFQTRVPGGLSKYRTHYVPSGDGKRFLINAKTGDSAPVAITVVLNWTAGLKR
jgi:Tol biopolymer transport system component/predicted Ser/Thr protein kinase